jgi:hypothetical protein
MNPFRHPWTFLFAALAALAMLVLPTVAAARGRDRNHDRIPDRWEKRHHLSLKVKQTWRDQDGDHLRNRQEFLAGTDPRDPDSDDDGIQDSQENAGRISSFDPDTGRLVIDLFGNDTVSGLVTDQTEIECEGSSAAVASHEDLGDDNPGAGDTEEHGSSDDSAPGPTNSGPGDDEGEHGDDGNGNCTAADLVEGAIVKEAELKLENEAAVFEEVELGS